MKAPEEFLCNNRVGTFPANRGFERQETTPDGGQVLFALDEVLPDELVAEVRQACPADIGS